MTSESHYSNGKLLLTGEYVVLDGALSLAVPTTFGQYLKITAIDGPKVIWKSLNYENNVWFEDSFSLQEITIGFQKLRNDKANRLLEILQAAKQLNPAFLNSGYQVETKLTFPQDWGLGTSSTLINNIANWAQVDAYKLLGLTFGGSGYDIACAQNDSAITYQLKNSFDCTLSENRTVKQTPFNPSFKEALYFVYLNKKQNSRDGIAQYRAYTTNKTQVVKEISNITTQLIDCSNISDFNLLLNKHEQLISSIIHQVPVKEKLFSDFNGAIKSLGAWGGDFVMVTSEENPSKYFKNKGFETMIPYSEIIK
ncbi:GYDIA family GHMP kinase [Xanthomarina sp. F2636L]|uniref:GYDIA family GHMP kinase n=1 Tax=Xanthomarina sp. F2636L TaxID=2996018 RepID=UPI00225DDBDB|nr:GYDIA family GHMP kinase [Xanthomarina sp. F2636L]MCX7550870.1 GYDIA family GHMP kinase [Xanthomarina sp. F2636L]